MYTPIPILISIDYNIACIYINIYLLKKFKNNLHIHVPIGWLHIPI